MYFMLDSQQQKENNEVIAHRFHMDIFQKGDLSVADEILDTNFVWRNPSIPSELAHGPQSTKKIAAVVIDSIPDLKIMHDDTMSENDKVMIRWTITGTTKKELFGIPASNKPITVVGFDLFRFASGKIVEMWQQFSLGTWS
jgi:predicted SnoaL-like aldol condensation-catalyzing enzyme